MKKCFEWKILRRTDNSFDLAITLKKFTNIEFLNWNLYFLLHIITTDFETFSKHLFFISKLFPSYSKKLLKVDVLSPLNILLKQIFSALFVNICFISIYSFDLLHLVVQIVKTKQMEVPIKETHRQKISIEVNVENWHSNIYNRYCIHNRAFSDIQTPVMYENRPCNLMTLCQIGT